MTRRDLVAVLVEARLLNIPALRVESLAVIVTLPTRIELLSLCASIVLVRTRCGVIIVLTVAITAQLVAAESVVAVVVTAESVVAVVVASESVVAVVVMAESVVVAAIMTIVVTVGSASGTGSTGACGTSRTGS